MEWAPLQEVLRRVVRIARPQRVILFGSTARNEQGARDLDLLVVKRDLASRGQLAARIYEGLVGAGVPVDIVLVTPDELARGARAVGSIVPAALRDGRTVYEEPGA